MIDEKLESSIADQIRKSLSTPMIGILQKIHFLEAGVLLIFANDGLVASSYLLWLTIRLFSPIGPDVHAQPATERHIRAICQTAGD